MRRRFYLKHTIEIKGAYENNLKNISLSIPKHKLVVVTGPSGSGKSTLAMDTLQRECQRQYMDSMGMATDSLSKSKVDSITGLSPSISVGQHVTNRNPRSTVGTVSDMYTYLRFIYEVLGERPCQNCATTIFPNLETDDTNNLQYCPNCNHPHERLTSSHFSFNTLNGACETCSGMGKVSHIRMESVFNEELSVKDGCVSIWYAAYLDYQANILVEAAKHYGFTFDLDMPLKDYSDVQRDLLYYGVESDEFKRHFPDINPPKSVGKGKFEGVLTGMWRRYKEKNGQSGDAAYFYEKQCHDCDGKRLKKESREVTVAGAPITDLSTFSLENMLSWLLELEQSLTPKSKLLVETVLHDFIVKVKRVIDVGLGYLSIDRQVITLSGGEAQRLRLANILGSGLTGVLYILDEPTAGLHPKDTKGLIHVMKQLRDLGNTVLVIEHDIEVMREADYIIDMGPEAGHKGGTVVGEGSLQQLIEQEQSVTGAFLREKTPHTQMRRTGNGQFVTISNATKHNLKDVTVSFPLGCFITVSGVSGSGKSTLVFDLLASEKNENRTGFEAVKNLVTVTQSPIGRMQRSNIATYTDTFTLFRNLFSSLPAAKEQGLKAKDFSFNTQGGRCENCQGLGFVTIDMHFLHEIEVKCPICQGKRFKDEILNVTYKEHSISSILDMTVEESLPLFHDHKKLISMIELLCEIGLGYLKWGQSVTTLSGGEGQRLKLAKDLNKQSKDHTLYLLDEPSTGLHPSDVKKLLLLLNRLVDAGNTVIVVEHNSDIIRSADWVIDMGPLGGEAGGMVVAEGTPETIAATEASYTGSFLK